MSPKRSRVPAALVTNPALFYGLLTLLFSPSALSAEAPQTSTNDSVLQEKRTATELPTKRKLPTLQQVSVNPPSTDAEIANRLNRIAKSQEVFQDLKATVSEGVVTVQGKVEEESYARSFTALSERVRGVIGVVDRIEILNQKKTGLRLAQSELQSLSQKVFKSLPYLLSSIVILAFTLLIGYGVFRFWSMILVQRFPTKQVVMRNLAKAFTLPIYVLGFYLVLQVAGFGGLAATLVGGTGMLGIILGLAAKNIIENILSSFMLTLRNPFKVGDEVAIGTESGIVHSLDSRCTMLLNHDGVLTQIPNSAVLAATIKNFSAHPLNRVSFTLEIDSSRDLKRFEKVFAEAVAKSADDIAESPAPRADLSQISGAKATMACSFWIDTQAVNSAEVKTKVMRRTLRMLEEAATKSEPSLPAVESRTDAKSTAPSDHAVLASRQAHVTDPAQHSPAR